LYIDGLFNDSKEITIDNTVTLRYVNLLKHTLTEDESNRKEQWEKVFDSIKKIKIYCDDRGIDFLLTIYPWGHQVNDKEWDSGRKDFFQIIQVLVIGVFTRFTIWQKKIT
jgi:hypothetical protein